MSAESDYSQRLPPHNRDAERSVLGSMLRDNGVIDDLAQILRRSGEDFYSDAHQRIYLGIVALHEKGQPVDLVILAEHLKQQRQIEDISGYPYLAELWDAAPTAANVEYYARIVRDKSIVRNVIHASNETLRDAYDQAQPAEEMLEQTERRFMDIANTGRVGGITRLRESISAVGDDYDERATRGVSGPSGLATGFGQLDETLAGLHPGELIVLGACTGVAKTQFALSIALHAAHREKVPVFYATLEMTHKECTMRLLALEGGFDPQRFRRCVMDQNDIAAYLAAGDRLRDAPIFYDDSAGQTMQRLASNARRLKLREKIGLIVVDYLQLVESELSRAHTTRQEAVATIARRLKNLAMELQVPIVAVSQLSRGAEPGVRPQLYHLRESGEIEQAANVVLFLYRPDLESQTVKVCVAKQRNGPSEIEIDFTLRWPPGRLEESMFYMPADVDGKQRQP